MTRSRVTVRHQELFQGLSGAADAVSAEDRDETVNLALVDQSVDCSANGG
jgi:hypothetical protein